MAKKHHLETAIALLSRWQASQRHWVGQVGNRMLEKLSLPHGRASIVEFGTGAKTGRVTPGLDVSAKAGRWRLAESRERLVGQSSVCCANPRRTSEPSQQFDCPEVQWEGKGAHGWLAQIPSLTHMDCFVNQPKRCP